MAECYNNCTTGSKKYVEINKGTSTVPSSKFWSEPITLGIDIVDKSLIIYDVVSVELYDLTLGTCIDSTGLFNLNPGESTRKILTARMPSSGNLSLRVSVSAFNFMDIPQTMVCQDNWDILVRGKDPGSTRYDCNSTTNKCEATLDGAFATSNCDNTCGGGGATGCVPECAQDSMCIFGHCVKRNDLLIAGGAVLAFMYFSKQ